MNLQQTQIGAHIFHVFHANTHKQEHDDDSTTDQRQIFIGFQLQAFRQEYSRSVAAAMKDSNEHKMK